MFEYFIVFAICMGGASWTAYNQGIRQGTETMLEILHEQKIIRFDDKGNIRPNPFFDS